MNASPLRSYLRNLHTDDPHVYRQSLCDLIQKICLLGLWRGTFFEHAAFYGGTALKMLYGLDRWSEDLDFSLLEEKPDFKLEAYLRYARQELEAWGITAQVEYNRKRDSKIESAFIKTNTLQTLISFDILPSALGRLHRDEVSSVKFEVDPHPPCSFISESRFLLEPLPFSIRVMSLPDLFAGKMHAVLVRGWLSRVKGRDWYDMIWFVSQGVNLNLGHLEARLRQSGHLQSGQKLTEHTFKTLLRERIQNIDYKQMANDVLPFIPDPGSLQNWSVELFESLVDGIKVQ